MKEIQKDKNLIEYCGLYCGACRSYLQEKCPGCRKNEKATWCKIRKCCQDNNYPTCADCKTFSEAKDCKKFNNFISKIFALIFRSDRAACVKRIKEVGADKYAEEMTEKKLQSIKK
ncbi:MAG: DUF3795 domain-containing protein [Candidatus Magasanikbacteria bacterium]|nr:DUF3795 domain-containing protein [Candidatus Magasanikbacteria bacterium]